MSIHDFIYKIKDKTGLDKITVLYLFIIIGVGITSFGLGRLSVDNNRLGQDKGFIVEETGGLIENENNSMKGEFPVASQSINQTQKKYVASKNGTKYYPLGCGGAKRIKPENEVWFNTKEEAEKSGYTMSVTCK